MSLRFALPGERTGESEKQWRASIKAYTMPRLGEMRVCDISTADVMSVLLPIWTEKAETACRVRQRIGAVMKWAIAQGYRPDNPAGAALPKNASNVKHFQTVHYKKAGVGIQKAKESVAGVTTKLLFEFITLCACRSSEARKATWTIPTSRMKAGKEHRVPLSDRAIEILREAEVVRQNDYVFPSPFGRILSDGTLTKLTHSLEIPETVHGMCSAFRDWVSEKQLRHTQLPKRHWRIPQKTGSKPPMQDLIYLSPDRNLCKPRQITSPRGNFSKNLLDCLTVIV